MTNPAAPLFLAIVHVTLSAALGYLLYKWMTRNKPITYARKWAGMLIGMVTVSTFPRVIRLHDSTSVALWLIAILGSGIVAAAAGWLYGKLKAPRESGE